MIFIGLEYEKKHMRIIHWLRVELAHIPALVAPPRKCPQCRSRKIDCMPPGTPFRLVADTFGLRVHECHDCSFAFLTWRKLSRG